MPDIIEGEFRVIKGPTAPVRRAHPALIYFVVVVAITVGRCLAALAAPG